MIKIKGFILVVILGIGISTSYAVYDTPNVSDSFNVARKIHLSAQASMLQIDLEGVGFSEVGIRPVVQFFPSKSFSLNIGYFTVVSTDGSSNFNGFDFGFRYYPFGAGTAISSSSGGISLVSHPKWTYYLGLGYYIRELRFNTANLTFSGFGFDAGAEWHISKNYYFGFEVGMGSLKNALGSSNVQNMSLTHFGFSIGTMF